jgi:hypothetical protein
MIQYKGIPLPTTVRDWQLFSTMVGSGKAARNLTAALKAAFVKFDAMVASGSTVFKALTAAGEVVNPVMRRYANLGAQDTEPRGVAAQAIVDYAKLRMLGTLAEKRYDWGEHIEAGLGWNPLKLTPQRPFDRSSDQRRMLTTLLREPSVSAKDKAILRGQLAKLPAIPRRSERGVQRIGTIEGVDVVAAPIARGIIQWSLGGGPSTSPIASGVAKTMKDVRREVRKAMRMHKAGGSYGWRDLDERTKGPVWVNAYIMERSYGGPEEGGWWYDDYTLLESKKVRRHHAKTVKAQMLKKHKGREWGDPSSVRGGERVKVLIEDAPGRKHTPTPHYE